MAIEARQQREFTGRHMLLVLLAFFGTVIGVNLVLAYYANHTWSGLVVPNSYVASQHFNEMLDRAAAQQALGWKSSMKLEGGLAAFDLKDRHGNPVGGLEVTATFERPVEEHEDFVLRLVDQSGDGHYVAPSAFKPGQWEVIVVANRDGESYRQVFHLIASMEK